jgi:hypothetical protein
MISCEGKGWTGKKYAKLVYFLAISENSGVQKERALRAVLSPTNHEKEVQFLGGVDGF